MTTQTTQTQGYEKLDPEVKSEWIAALRSKQYKQGTGQLCDANNQFCCLGVLVDACVDTEWVEVFSVPWSLGDPVSVGWGVVTQPYNTPATGSLPMNLRKKINLDPDAEDKLVSFNDDSHWSFKKIATWIERYL